MAAAWRWSAEVDFLEAEVRGSVSYSVNGFQSVQAFHGAAGGGDVFTLQSIGVLREPFACFSGPISDRNCLLLFLLFFFAPLLVSFSCVGGRDSVFVILHLSSPQSLRCCISVDFYTVLLQLCSKQCVVIL